jgi:membrane protease YdiL (CAAX protease family)
VTDHERDDGHISTSPSEPGPPTPPRGAWRAPGAPGATARGATPAPPVPPPPPGDTSSGAAGSWPPPPGAAPADSDARGAGRPGGSARPDRPSLADAIVLPIWVLAGQLVGGLLILPLMLVQGLDIGMSQEALIGVTVVLGWSVVGVGLWLWLRLRGAWQPDWHAGHAPWSTLKASMAGVGGALGGFVVMQLMVAAVVGITGQEPPEQEIFELLSDPMLAWVIGATAVLAAPIVEEIVFRGVVMDVLRRRWGWWTSALVQAAIFSAIHIETLTSATMFVTLAMLGFIFAWLRRVTGSLVAPIVAHLVFNLISLVLSLAVGA